MVNEVGKSFLRTLGRILAYILVGFLLFVLFNEVKADTIDTTYAYIQSIHSDWSVGFSTYGSSLNDYTPGALGFQWTPVDSNDAAIPITESEYYINIQFMVAYNTTLMGSFMPNFNFQVSTNFINASCDGFEDLMISDRVNRNNQLYITYDYVCDSFTTTSDFNRIRFREYMSSIQNNLYQVQFFILQTELIDVNQLNQGDKYIGEKIDSSADKIIENQNNIFQQWISNNNQNMSTMTINSQNEVSAINNINSTLSSSSVDSPSSSFGSFNNNVASTSGIETIFLLPVTLIRTIINNNSGTCSTISLGSLYGTNLNLPCINIESYLGSTIYTIIDLFCCFALIMGLRKYVLEIFNKITSLKEDSLND